MFTMLNHGLNLLQWTNILDFFALKLLSLHKYKFYQKDLLYPKIIQLSGDILVEKRSLKV